MIPWEKIAGYLREMRTNRLMRHQEALNDLLSRRWTKNRLWRTARRLARPVTFSTRALRQMRNGGLVGGWQDRRRVARRKWIGRLRRR